MMLWENQAGRLVELSKEKLDQEVRLEEWVAKDSSLLGIDVLIIGRQVHTPFGGRIDLLAIDAQGDILIIELKRDRTPREVVAQVLDYASWINNLTPREVADMAAEYLKRGLAEVFKDRFDNELPETINANHRMVI